MHMLWMRSLILLQINLAFGIERSCVFQGLTATVCLHLHLNDIANTTSSIHLAISHIMFGAQLCCAAPKAAH